VNFVFGNNFGPPLFVSYPLNPTERALSQTIAGYWSRFAGTGNPNTDDPAVVHWPAFTRPSGAGRGVDKQLVFDVPIHEGQRLREAQCDFWEPYFFRSASGSVSAGTP
jgi:carboxylesterase type B